MLKMDNHRRDEEEEEEEEEEEDDEDEDNEEDEEEEEEESFGEEGGPSPHQGVMRRGHETSLDGLSPACRALLKQALVAQVTGQAEKAVQTYLMTFKIHPAAAPKFRDEFLSVLKLHISQLVERRSVESGLPLCRLAVSVLPQDTDVMTLLGRILFMVGQEGEARRQWQAAIDAASSDLQSVEARESLDLLNARAVNRWHYRMINDPERNKSYHDAILRAVKRRSPGAAPVLDIGAGTGLLAIYAARSSEGNPIWACEMSEPMVEIAREVLQANCLSHRIKLLSKHSDDVRVDDDDAMCADDAEASSETPARLNKRVAVIVTETADCGLLGESMMPSLRVASQNLLADGGQTIPCKADVHALLVHSPILRSQGRINENAMCGVVLSSVVTLIPQDPYLCEYLSECGHVALSDAFTGIQLPFGCPRQSSNTAHANIPEFSPAANCVSEAGRCEGVAAAPPQARGLAHSLQRSHGACAAFTGTIPELVVWHAIWQHASRNPATRKVHGVASTLLCWLRPCFAGCG